MRIRPMLVGACVLLAPVVCTAQTLAEAVGLAYETNPTLRAKRAELRAIDEEYVQATSGYRPIIGATAQAGYQFADLDQQSFLGGYTSSGQQAETGQADLSIVQPLYTGGEVHARVDGASADIRAAREALRRAEGQVLLQTVIAYVDVRRDRETVDILQQEAANLEADCTEIRAQGSLGALSQTDVALAEGRLLEVRVQIEDERTKLAASQAAFVNVVGQNPGALANEPELRLIPQGVEPAFDTAEISNPELKGAIQTELAARAKVAEAKAASAPKLAMRVDVAVEPIAPYIPRQYDRNVTAALTYNQSFYTGGLNSSRVHEALERDNKAAMDIEVVRRQVVQLVSQAWAQYAGSRRSVELEETLLKSDQKALQGSQAEHRAGLRSTTELLNAEVELANARLRLAVSRRDAYVAGAGLLNAMGVLDIGLLAPTVTPYRPEDSFKRRVRHSALPLDGPVSFIDSINAPRQTAPISATLTRPAVPPGAEDRPPP